jgi:hypothetical protein
MRKLTTAITAAALAFSMVAAAVPAAAVTGYDSAYAGESAFVKITGGQTQNFQVFFANTGTTSWQKGTSTQVDLAACLEDKVTCNAQDASEATWNSGWLSATRYASTSQTLTPPGSLGTFSYNITAPVGVAAGIYHFNGDLVLASTGEKIHPEGYFQDADTGAASGVATITKLTPNSGTNAGGNTVSIDGTGIVCTPAFPTVAFGTANAVVTSCGATALTVKAPAAAVGTVTVTVTNPGAGASNGLTYTYADKTPPTFTGQSIASNVVTVTYSELVCRTAAFNAADWQVRNVSAGVVNVVTGDTTPVCAPTTAPTNGVTTAKLFLTTAVPPGAFTEVTLLELVAGAGNNPDIRDIAGNLITAPQAQTATATNPSTNPPTMVSASGAVGDTKVKVTFSEPIFCPGGTVTPGHFTLSSGTAGDPTFSAITPPCPTAQNAAVSSLTLTTTILPADKTYTLTFTPTANNQITNVYNVSLANPPSTASVTFTTGAADFTPPTIIDARLTNNVGSSNFTEPLDAFTLTFSEKMAGTASPTRHIGSISIQDQDGTTATINCTAAAGANGTASCTWNAAITTLTVTLDSTLNPDLATTTPCCLTGTTPGMQIPFNITAVTGITDVAGNPPNILGSPDRLVNY